MTDPIAGLADLCPALRVDLLAAGYTVDGLASALGPAAVSALGRSDAAGVRRAARGAGSAGVLTRLFVLRDDLPAAEVAAVLPSVDPDEALATGLLSPVPDAPGCLRAGLDLRPVDTGHGSRWVFSDVDGSMVHVATRPDHVLGVGQASLSLLAVTPTSPVDTLLDLGTGCGIQLLHGLPGARSAVGTDLTPRCLHLTAATLAINGLDAELVEGSWFAPVAGRRFDRIVANPPFVVGPDEIGHSYRESGLELDGASRTVVTGAPEHLADGGTAVLLASWVHLRGQDWRTRVASWVPPGVDAWVVQRDVTDPGLHVWTWLTDEGMDPRDPATVAAADRWLDHLDRHEVTGIGFGYVFLRRLGPTDQDGSVLCEDLTHPFDGGLGDEAEAYFDRLAWLRREAAAHGSEAAALDAAVLRVAPDVQLHSSVGLGTPDDPAELDGPPAPEAYIVERTSGPRWRHEVDGGVRRLLLGLRTGALPLADVVALAAAADGVDADELFGPARAVVLDLLRHGVVVPAGIRP